MLRVGLTGGIGCGKTTVAAMMRELGCHVLEADKMAHRLIEPGQPAYDAVVREFGRDILTSDGRPNRSAAPSNDLPTAARIEGRSEARSDARFDSPLDPRLDATLHEALDQALDAGGDTRSGPRIDRAKLAAIVFADPARLGRLNSIVHPPLLAAIDRELARFESSDPHGIAVIDAALLIEFNHYAQLDRVVVVWCTPEQQLARLMDQTFGRGMPREQAERRIAAQLDSQEKRKLATDEIDCSGTLEDTRRQVELLVREFKRLANLQLH